jgi:acyl-CoA synthetase (AMP-forming)/AMP-acid ligase II
MQDFVARNARRIPDRAAIVWQGRPTSWRILDERIDRLARGLAAKGVRPGVPVIYALDNGPELVELVQALYRLGAIAVPMLSRSVEREISHVAEDVGAKMIFAAEGVPSADLEAIRLGDEYERLIRDSSASRDDEVLDPDAPIMIRYTSGTTGEQKGVIRTRRIVETATLMYLAHAPQTDADSIAICSPLTVGLAGAMLQVAFAAGATSHIMPKFDAGKLLDMIARDKITMAYAIMAMFDEVTRHPDLDRFDLSSLRHFTGSSATQDTLGGLQRLRAHPSFRGEFFNAYGSTECGAYVAVHLPDELEAELNDPSLAHRIESIGREAMLCRVACLDEELRPVKQGEVGEMAVQAPTVFKGYWNRPEETAEVLRDGWLLTGDMAWKDRDGFIFLAGRKRDMIKSGGLNVYPAEIEFVLSAMSVLSEVAVVGVPDEKWGEKVVACVVSRAPCQAEDVLRFCRGKLAGHKIPKEVVFMPDLPKNETGKVVKRSLRERLISPK